MGPDGDDIDQLALPSRHQRLERQQSGRRETFRDRGINPLVRRVDVVCPPAQEAAHHPMMEAAQGLKDLVAHIPRLGPI